MSTSIPVVRVPSVPSIVIFVRHSADCNHAADESYKRCRCPKHLRWSYGGRQFRQSAKTRSWQAAEERRREIEERFKNATAAESNGAVAVQAVTRPTIDKAIQLFIIDKRSQGLDANFLKRYERELGRMSDFMASRSVLFPTEIQLHDLTEFRAGWDALYPSSITRAKVQERLRGFLRYCFNARLIDRIPKLSPIKIDEPPTMPLSEAEYKTLIKAVPNVFSGDKARRIHALIQLMRWTGLAMQDAVTLKTAALSRDKGSGLYRIQTHRQKTGTHVSVPIEAQIARELLSVAELNSNQDYFFWTGNGKVKTALSDRGNDLRKLFRNAGFPEGHPHQLRDTFAVHLLQKGVPLEEVSKLLGHESIKTTEKHYAKWVKSRQDRLDMLVTATWKPKKNKRD